MPSTVLSSKGNRTRGPECIRKRVDAAGRVVGKVFLQPARVGYNFQELGNPRGMP